MRVNAKIIEIQDDGDFINIEWVTEKKQTIDSRYTGDNRSVFLKRLGQRDLTSISKIKAALFNISIFESKGELKVRPESIMTDAEIQAISVTPAKNNLIEVVPVKTVSKDFKNKEWAAEQGRLGSMKLHNRKALSKTKESTLKLLERQKDSKLKCSPNLLKMCTQLNSLIDEELKNYQ